MTPNAPALRSLPWRPDALLHYFNALVDTPWAMLLHSGFAQHQYNRFDILVAEPRATLVTHGKETLCCIGENSTLQHGDPLQLLQQTLERFTLHPASHPDIPFLGGALGLFGYDLGRRFESLPNYADSDLNTPDMAVGIYDWALIADHQKQRITLVSVSQEVNHLRYQFIQTLETKAYRKPFCLTGPWQANMTRKQYGEKFQKIQGFLRSGDCYQVNLSQRFCAPYTGDEWQAFNVLNAENKAPFSAFLRLPESTIMSLSPERFIHLRNNKIQTRPIKGTRPRLNDEYADRIQAQKLASSAKDRAENVMIVDLLRNDIGRVATPGSVKVPELFVVEPFPAVHHLVSTITAHLTETLNPTDLLRACFPGGSITGAPKVRAMEIIEELEPQRRNAWCGSIGYISFCGSMDTNITIRTLIAERGYLYCQAGGGIVADSVEEEEYQETFDKVRRIMPHLEKL